MPRNKTWFNLEAKETISEIAIFDEIDSFWGIGPKEFKAELAKLPPSGPIRLSINSPGGSVFDGMTIYHMLAKYHNRLDVIVTGLAASIASIIALAGKSLTMAQGSFYMIHNPMAFTAGDSASLRRTAEVLDKMREEFINIYADHSNLDRDSIGDLMDGETWMDSLEAIENGFAAGEVDMGLMAANVDPDGIARGFANIPARLKMAAIETVSNPRELEHVLRDAGYSRRNAAAIVAASKSAGLGDPSPVAQGDPVKKFFITPAMLIAEMDAMTK